VRRGPRSLVRRALLAGSAACVLAALALPALAQDEAAAKPAVWHGTARAGGLTFEVDRDALLPVADALRFTALDGKTAYDTDQQTARASLLYPGEGVLQGPNLVCGTFGGAFPPEAKPILDLCATYDFPLSVSADASTPDKASVGNTHLGKITDPISADAASAHAHATVDLTSSDAEIENLRVLGLPLVQILSILPIEQLKIDPTVVGVESASARTKQLIDDSGKLVVQATSVLSGVKLVGGLIDIGSIRSTSRITDDGKGKRTSDASFEATGVTVAGVPAQITENGLVLGGPSGASGPLQQTLINALQPLLQGLGVKLSLLGSHEALDENGQAVANANGILLEISLGVHGAPSVPGPLGDIDLSGTYVGNVEIGATEAAGAASIFDPDAPPPVDEGGAPIDIGGGGGDIDVGGGDFTLPPTSPEIPNTPVTPTTTQVERAAAIDLFGGRLELLYAAFALAVLGLCIAPRLTVTGRLPGPTA
jgi:hypothetical protein